MSDADCTPGREPRGVAASFVITDNDCNQSQMFHFELNAYAHSSACGLSKPPSVIVTEDSFLADPLQPEYLLNRRPR